MGSIRRGSSCAGTDEHCCSVEGGGPEMESGPKNPRNQRRARRYNRALKKLLERRAKQAWQKQLEWLRRPRLHTAIFEDARRDDQIADDWASKHKMSIEEREIVER